jgi:hypothetical protein
MENNDLKEIKKLKKEKSRNFALKSGNIFSFYLITWLCISAMGLFMIFGYGVEINWILIFGLIMNIPGSIFSFIGKKFGVILFLFGNSFLMVQLIIEMIEKSNVLISFLVLLGSVFYFIYKIIKLWKYLV